MGDLMVYDMRTALMLDLLDSIKRAPVIDLAELRYAIGDPVLFDDCIIALCDSQHIVLSQDCDIASLGDKLADYVTDPDNASIVYTCASPRR